MIRSPFILLIGMVFFQFSAAGQVDSLVHSGDCVDKARRLYDSGKYEFAIKELKRIDPRDTNYVYSLSELAKSYFENEQYAESISTGEKGLSVPSPFRASLFNTSARAYAALRDFEKAIATLNTGIKEFPFDASLAYRLGLVFYEQKKFDEAEIQLFKTLDLNPYFSGAHLFLSKIAMLRGQKVRGMFSMGVYLAINNSVNSQLVILEHFVKNELTDEYTIAPSTNPFERLDEILRAKISFEEEYKIKIPIDLGIVKQYQLLFEQLGEQAYTGDDPWMKFYLVIYNDLRKSNMQEPFVYHILESAPPKQIAQWKEKNKKVMQQFYEVMNNSLTQFRNTRSLPDWGYQKKVTCTYSNNGILESIGEKDQSDKKTGKWYYFDDHGVRLAEGPYKQNNKTGVWNYFNNSGILTSIENYDTGEVRSMDADGNIARVYFLKDDRIDGAYTFYYACGVVNETRNYQGGKKESMGKAYFPDGNLEAEFSYNNDSLQGKFINWYEGGTKHIEQEYDNGKSQGKFTSYFRNGGIMATGNYDHGKATGTWSYYYANGKQKQQGNFKNDLQFGEWSQYNVRGELVDKSSYNEKGNYHGESFTYHEGKPQSSTKYADNLITAVTYYDKSGNIISAGENPEGTFKGKGYFPTGELRVEYSYVKGQRHGPWKYYFRSGTLETTCEYLNGKLNGEYLDYSEDGALKTKSYYTTGQLNGPYQEYFQNSKLKSSGWYQTGNKQQKWLSYYPDGSIESDTYYLNDSPVGFTINFSEVGKPYSRTEYYQTGKVKEIIRYNEDGSRAVLSSENSNNNTHQVITRKYKTGRIAFRTELTCSDWDGETSWHLSNEKPFLKRSYRNGKQHGKYFSSYPDGFVEGVGEYTDDKPTGTWTWYHNNGSISSQGKYLDGQQDSVWNYYHYNGKLSSTGTYLDNEKQGVSDIFGPEGQHILSKLYNEGDLISYRTMGKDGKLSDWIPFRGSGKIESYYSNGNLAIEENYKNGSYDKAKKIFYPSGKLYSIYTYNNNLLNGESFLYYPDGKIKEKKIYKDDYATGKWEYYEPNGNFQRTEPYVLGNLSGMVELFSDGKKIKEQKFWYGTPVD